MHLAPDVETGEAFGVLLRRFRLRAGLSQEELGEKAGISASAVSAIEQGIRRRPRPHTAVAVAEALDLTAAERGALLVSAELASFRPSHPSPSALPTATQRSRLPVAPTRLIGRSAEVIELRELLLPSSRAHTRLLTLVGPGGVGKTRLALAVAESLVDAFTHGVLFVELAPLHDHRLVSAYVARALELQDSGGGGARELLLGHLKTRQVLLVLDNFEHLFGALPLVLEVFQRCPHVTLLITSRTVLRLRAERTFSVAPLPTRVHPQATPQAIADSPAVSLFVERAREVVPDFAIDESNAHTVAAVCQRLDGIPLAIELAAARAQLLRPAALLQRLERRLHILTSPAPDLPERQRTLRNTLAWSRDLLGPCEEVLFRRLAVFAGSWTLEAAEAVCADAELPSDEMLDRLETLVDNSLVRRLDQGEYEARFGMLETVREYAHELLVASHESAQLRARHQEWCLAFAEQAAPELAGPQQELWLERLERALDDVRVALSTAEEHGQTELGLRLSGGLGRFWATRHYVVEGSEWLERFLAAPDAEGAPALVRAQACYAAGLLANLQGDQVHAAVRLEECLELYHVGGDLVGAVRALNTRGGVAYDQGHLAFAAALWKQSMDQARKSGDLGEMSHAVGNLGEAHFHMGDLQQAATCHTEALALAQQARRADLVAMQLGNLGNVAREQGDLTKAAALQRQALAVKWQLGARRQVAITLADLASIAGAQGDGDRAARLLGAAIALREYIGTPQPVPERAATERAVADSRARLGEEAWSAAFAAGKAQPLEQAIAYALA